MMEYTLDIMEKTTVNSLKANPMIGTSVMKDLRAIAGNVSNVINLQPAT